MAADQDAPDLEAERTDGDLLLREVENADAWMKGAPVDAEP